MVFFCVNKATVNLLFSIPVFILTLSLFSRRNLVLCCLRGFKCFETKHWLLSHGEMIWNLMEFTERYFLKYWLGLIKELCSLWDPIAKAWELRELLKWLKVYKMSPMRKGWKSCEKSEEFVFNYSLQYCIFIQFIQIFIDHLHCVGCCCGPWGSYRCEPDMDPDPKGLVFRKKINHMNTMRDV